jgi:hypothetical protein
MLVCQMVQLGTHLKVVHPHAAQQCKLGGGLCAWKYLGVFVPREFILELNCKSAIHK